MTATEKPIAQIGFLNFLGNKFSGGLKEYPLNRAMVERIEKEALKGLDGDFSDVLVVRPLRSQMRSVIIFAVPRTEGGKVGSETMG